MKKSIFIGALALITLAACQNEREDVTKENSEIAINVVKRYASGLASKEPPSLSNDVAIQCHTSYFDSWGVACVSVNGQMYRVTWSPGQKDPGSNEPAQTSYSSTKVSSCSCG